jgi:hypothetical protein
VAVAESVAALQALLDAVALALSGRAAEGDAILGPLSSGLEELRALIAPEDSRFGSSLLSAAFLGVREILWEISSRGQPSAGPSKKGETEAGGSNRPTGTGRSRRSTRVRRVPVEG